MARIRRLPVSVAAAVFLMVASGPAQAASGDLDPTFNRGGKHITDFKLGPDAAYAVLVQPDGRLVLAGGVDGNGGGPACDPCDFGLLRYTANGARDSTFGSSGDRGGGGKFQTSFGPYDFAHAVQTQPDGMIVAAGVALVGTELQFAVARYTSNGFTDATFGVGGKTTSSLAPGLTDTTAHAVALAIQPDGKLVLGGGSAGDLILVRLNADGTLDEGFGTGGKVTTDLGGADAVHALALQPDGAIVVAGSDVVGSGPDANFALARYTAGGIPDATFGAGGYVTTSFTSFGEGIHGLGISGDKLVAVGHAFITATRRAFALARYNLGDGSLDTTFAVGGKKTTSLGTNSEARAVGFQGTKIVVVGASDNNFATAVYLP